MIQKLMDSFYEIDNKQNMTHNKASKYFKMSDKPESICRINNTKAFENMNRTFQSIYRSDIFLSLNYNNYLKQPLKQ